MAGLFKAGVCFFAHDGKGKYLLGKRGANLKREPGTWSPGAGGVEFNESIEDALKREIKEEYNADVLDYQFMGYRHFINTEGDHALMFDFKALVDPNQVKNNEPESCDGLEWLTMEELKNHQGPFHPQMQLFMDKNRHYFV